MGSPDQEREQELAELLREVRALRETLDQLKAAPAPRLPPDYAVLARTQSALPPDYAVAVRTSAALPPDYAVLVRQALPPDYAVLVRDPSQALPPTYEVLVRPVGPGGVEGPAVEP
jgi:hypothetical protein